MNKNWLVSYTHTLRPNLLNDFRIGYHHIDFDTVNPFYVDGPEDAGTALGIPGFDGDTKYNNPGLPSINVSNFSGLGAGGTNWFQFDTTFQVSNVLAYNRGSHNIRAGFDLRRLATGRRAANDPRGLFDFSGQMTGYSVADFMIGLPRTVIPPTDQIQGHVGGWRNGFFVNDAWQASRNLTLNIGLRYELNTPVQTYAGFASMLAEDQETIIPRTFPSKGFEFHDAELHGHCPASWRHLSPRRQDGSACGLWDLLQPESDELVHVPDQQPAVGRRHDLHLRPGESHVVIQEPHRPGWAGGSTRHDLADARPAQCPQGSVELRRAAGSRSQHGARISSMSVRTPAIWIAAFSATRRRQVRAPSIRGGRARSSAAAASSRTISSPTTTRSASSFASG